jgi:hypothetical protein
MRQTLEAHENQSLLDAYIIAGAHWYVPENTKFC